MELTLVMMLGLFFFFWITLASEVAFFLTFKKISGYLNQHVPNSYKEAGYVVLSRSYLIFYYHIRKQIF